MEGKFEVLLLNYNESITHLPFDCHHAKEIWRIVYLATGLTPPRLVSHMLENSLSNFSDKERCHVSGGSCIVLGYLEIS